MYLSHTENLLASRAIVVRSDRRYIKKSCRQEKYEISKTKLKYHTDRAIAADTCAPSRGGVYYAEFVLDTIWTCGGLRDNVSGGRFGSFDLHEAFRANGLVTTS